MGDEKMLAERFEAERGRLRGVAYRMLGSLSDAEDAVQEGWIRVSRAERGGVKNLSGWMTTVVARVCLDMLRSRKARHEEEMGEAAGRAGGGADPREEAELAEAVGLALMVVLEALGPAERVAFVLHDLFGMGFEEIGGIVGRSAEAARQLASRARRRVRGAEANAASADVGRQRAVVEAYLAAARAGDIEGLLAVLDPDVVVRADAAAVARGAAGEVRGAAAVAGQATARRARFAQAALVDGAVGLVVAPRGRLLVVLRFAIEGGKVVGIEVVGDGERLGRMEVAVL